MSDIVKMSVEHRPGVGKGAARTARRAGFVPGVIYGGKEDPVSIQIKGNELLKTLNKGGFYTTIFEIDVAGTAHRVIPKAIQKNNLNGLPVHVDFMRLVKGASVVVEIPVEFVNEKASPGLERGGVLNIVRHAIELDVPADAMPDVIEIDLAGFDLGDGIHISHVKLPKGAKPTITDRDFTIATIATPSALASSDNTSDEEGGDEASGDGAEKGEDNA